MAPRAPRSWLVALTVAAALLAGCGSDDATETAGDTPSGGAEAGSGEIEDRAWTLDADATGVTLAENEAVTLLFADGRFGGFNVCNQFGGDASIDGDRITIGESMSTMAGCVNGDVAADVDAVLRGTATFVVDGDRLVLRGESGEATLTFVEVPPAFDVDQAAVAGTWQVSPPTGGPPAATPLTFAADGRYDVTLGCTEMSGRWEVDRGRITAPEQGAAVREECLTGDGAFVEPSPDEVLVGAALDGAHLRPAADGRLEVLDRTGAPVALLVPTAG